MSITNEASRRRRIVYHATAGRLAADEVAAAVKLCDREFQNTPVFSVRQFLSRFSQVVGEPANSGELFAAMNRLRIINDLEAIGPDPVGPTVTATAERPDRREAAPSRAERAAAPKASSRIEGWADTFNALLSALLAELRRLSPTLPDDIRGAIVGATQGAGLNFDSATQLTAWASGESDVFTDRTTPQEMHAILHALYMWTCEELGPVETDRLFGAVLREVSQHPGAAQFPPRSLM